MESLVKQELGHNVTLADHDADPCTRALALGCGVCLGRGEVLESWMNLCC